MTIENERNSLTLRDHRLRLEKSQLLDRLFGPANRRPEADLTRNDQCSIYGGCRMFLCQCFTDEDDASWFSGYCQICLQKIKYFNWSLRLPRIGGGWSGCYCSFKHLYQDLPQKSFEPSDDAQNLTEEELSRLVKTSAIIPEIVVDRFKESSKQMESLGISHTDPEEFEIADLIGKYDYKQLLRAGNLRMQMLYRKGSKDFEQYLQNIKYQMRKITYSKFDISANDPNYHMEIRRAFGNGFEPIKLDEPNETWCWMWENRHRLAQIINWEYDNHLSYMAVITLEKTYLLKDKFDGKILELPQQLFLRVACALHFSSDDQTNFETIERIYKDIASLRLMPASPTLFNAGTTISQMSSCFLIAVDDNIPSILWANYVIGVISKVKGATGASIGAMRGSGATIGSNGICSGILNFEKCLDTNVLYINQGGQRPGAAQVCLPVWHSDIFSHIEATKKTGNMDLRIKKLDTSVSTYDLFWERVIAGENWSLFCPSQFTNEKGETYLHLLYGSNFREAYLAAEKAGKAKKTVPARSIVNLISSVLKESGRPYVINVDTINNKSNQKNIGTIKSLNLCQEIALVADKDRIPSCNLSSICLANFVENGVFNWAELARVSRESVFNLNKVIERNYYPLPEIRFANEESAPIGIGFQGAIDAILLQDMIFDSKQAEHWMEKVMACVYFNALSASWEIAKKRGYPYRAFPGSPYSQGKFQFDLWNDEAADEGRELLKPVDPASWGQTGETWETLREKIIQDGLANSQILTSQPTAGVTTITGAGEGWEPLYSNFFTRDVNNGSFLFVNKYLQDDLIKLGLWHTDTTNWIQSKEGSIQGISSMVDSDDPELIKRLQFLEEKYRTVFEYNQEIILKHAAVRGPYIDGSQSTNLYLQEPPIERISDLLIYGYKLRLKTLIYYLRTKEAKTAIKSTLRRVADKKLKVIRGTPVSIKTSSEDGFCVRGPGEPNASPAIRERYQNNFLLEYFPIVKEIS